MPRSFLVKRRKSDSSEIPFEGQIDKALTCATTGYPIHFKCRDGPDNHPPKTLFIEYHSPVPQYIPGKSTGHHGNSAPCYLCHHGNMIPPPNGCISYAPVQVPPRYNGVCFCLVCQQRAVSLSCNCQSCLSLRFEQTAASVLEPNGKKLSINKAAVCCNGVLSENIPLNQLQYPQYCHCAECISRMSKDFRISNNLQVIAQRHDNIEPEGVPQKDKDQNNNDSGNDQNESSNIKTDREQQQRLNGNISPKAKELTDEHQGTPCSENQDRKRKQELKDDCPFVSKVIKRENIEKTFEVEITDETTSVDQEEKDLRIPRHTPSPKEEKEELNGESIETQNNDSSQSSPREHHKNQFDYEEGNTKNNCHDSDYEFRKGRGHRHYNMRHSSTKTSYDNQELPKLKNDKEMYTDLTKSISRQRTKLNRLLANEHERRRVAQLNSAYQDLRQLIPGYQCDTKLPKIKILRYAINYIAHLDNILEMDAEKERV